MTTFAWDIPGYVQGHRFSQAARYYDAANERFRDLAGYDHFGNYCEVVTGSPAFSEHGDNSREGLLLDKTCQLKFLPAMPWAGSMLLVARPVLATGTVTLYGWMFATSATLTTNGTVRWVNSSGTRTVNMNGPGGTLSSPALTCGTGNIVIAAFSRNQEDRIARSTLDGVTINASAADAGTTSGNAVAMGGIGRGDQVIGGVDGSYVRLGDLAGDGDTVANGTDYFHLFEQHFWKGDVLQDNPTELAELIASLGEHYAVA